jgi:hypothetical protein
MSCAAELPKDPVGDDPHMFTIPESGQNGYSASLSAKRSKVIDIRASAGLIQLDLK